MSGSEASLFAPPICQSTTTFDITNNQSIIISSEFDSGNIQVIKQISDFQYRLSAVTDNQNSEFRMNSKSWFYFSVEAKIGLKLSFYIEKVQCLYQIMEGKFGNVYRPVVKQNGQWKRLSTECRLTMKYDDAVQINFDYSFKNCSKVYFAFCYPFSYQENIQYLEKLNPYLNNQKFYYNKQLFVLSPQKRQVHLLTITSHNQDTQQLQPIFNENLFPELNRSKKFNKPVVLITARVHPGESSASYSMIGIIDFLMSDDLRSVMLREMFVFMIVPMINVDGVYRGNFRMDLYGKNLNRYYIDPDVEKQPAPYAIKKLSQYLNNNKRLSFYFDLHAHNSKKGCFIYGNAIDDFVDQVQSNTFCKIVSLNTKFFEYQECTFSLKHMKLKDRCDDITKQGCARVVMHKTAGIIHSYSLQCGLISSNTLNYLPDLSNKQFKCRDYGLIEDELQNNQNPIFQSQSPLYTQEMYQNVGKALMVSILDTFDKNPYSRIISSTFSSMSNLRRIMASQIFHEAQRFRMFQKHIYLKVRKIGELMHSNFRQKFVSSIFNIQDSSIFKDIIWPDNILGLQKQIKKKNNNLDKNLRNSIKSQSDQPIDREFRKPFYDSYCEELSSTAIQSNNDVEPLQYNPEQFRFSPYPQYLKLPILPDKARNSPTYPISTITFQNKQLQLKSKIKSSIKKELKIELYEELYPFGDRTIRLQARNSTDLPSNLIFVKNRSNSNATQILKQKRIKIQRNSIKIKAISKRQRQIQSKEYGHSFSINQNSNSVSLKLESSFDNIDKTLKQRQNYIQMSVSDTTMSPINRQKFSNIKLMFPTSAKRDMKNDIKLPKILGLGEKDQPKNQLGDLNTVELDLIDKDIEYRSQQANKQIESKMKVNLKVFNRLRKVKK